MSILEQSLIAEPTHIVEAENSLLETMYHSKAAVEMFRKCGFGAEDFTRKCSQELFDIISFYMDEDGKVPDDVENRVQLSLKPSELKVEINTLARKCKLAIPHSVVSVPIEQWLSVKKVDEVSRVNHAFAEALAKNPTKAMDTLAEYQQKFSQIQARYVRNFSKRFGEDAETRIDRLIERGKNPDAFMGIHTPLESLTARIWGWKTGLHMIYGAMKSGKSCFAINCVIKAVKQGKRVLYHSNEGDDELPLNRLDACGTGIFHDCIASGQLTPEDRNTLVDFEKQINAAGLIFIQNVSPSESTSKTLEAEVRRIEDTIGSVDLVIVDILGRFNPVKKSQHTHEVFGFAAEELMDFAMRHNIPVIALSHLNREGSDDMTEEDDITIKDVGSSIIPTQHAVSYSAWWQIKDKLPVTPVSGSIMKMAKPSIRCVFKIMGARSAESDVKIYASFNPNTIQIKEVSLDGNSGMTV